MRAGVASDIPEPKCRGGAADPPAAPTRLCDRSGDGRETYLRAGRALRFALDAAQEEVAEEVAFMRIVRLGFVGTLALSIGAACSGAPGDSLGVPAAQDSGTGDDGGSGAGSSSGSSGSGASSSGSSSGGASSGTASGSGSGGSSSSGGSSASSSSGSSSSGSSGGQPTPIACGRTSCTASSRYCCQTPVAGEGGASDAGALAYSCVAMQSSCVGATAIVECASGENCAATQVCCRLVSGGVRSQVCELSCLVGEVQLCASDAECSAGQLCRIPTGTTTGACSEPGDGGGGGTDGGGRDSGREGGRDGGRG